MDSHTETKLPAVFAGMALFLLWGLVLISGEILHEWLQLHKPEHIAQCDRLISHTLTG